jgi:hypothetical protein
MPDVYGKLNIYGKLAIICCAAGPTIYFLQTVETTFLILIDPNICGKKHKYSVSPLNLFCVRDVVSVTLLIYGHEYEKILFFTIFYTVV